MQDRWAKHARGQRRAFQPVSYVPLPLLPPTVTHMVPLPHKYSPCRMCRTVGRPNMHAANAVVLPGSPMGSPPAGISGGGGGGGGGEGAEAESPSEAQLILPLTGSGFTLPRMTSRRGDLPQVRSNIRSNMCAHLFLGGSSHPASSNLAGECPHIALHILFCRNLLELSTAPPPNCRLPMCNYFPMHPCRRL